ncbi:MAG: MFS transporter [Porticoccaceae bacterium]|nr:MFS transporter [Porticoccaceae bacterium]
MASINKEGRWLTMVLLCLSGGTIYLLPFLREIYYIPIQQAFGYSNTQMGILFSLFGLASMLSYFPGGWLADRYSPRKLIFFSLLGVGLGGLYFATLPSYNTNLALHFFWGLCTSLIFWGAMIKATRTGASSEEQGRAFGILESGRGIVEVAISSAVLAVFAWLGSQASALSQVINLYSWINIALAIMTWRFLEDDSQRPLDRAPVLGKVSLADILMVLKMPSVWLIATIVLTTYSANWGAYYFTPYATTGYSLSVLLGASIGVSKMWLKPIAATSAGFIADRFGVAKTVFALTLAMSGSFVAFAILPGGKGYLFLMLINVAIASSVVFALRGIYFALLDDSGVAPAVTGTAVGVISAIGFTPDFFMPILGGMLLDSYPGVQGYRYYFGVIAIMSIFGVFAAHRLMKKSQ